MLARRVSPAAALSSAKHRALDCEQTRTRARAGERERQTATEIHTHTHTHIRTQVDVSSLTRVLALLDTIFTRADAECGEPGPDTWRLAMTKAVQYLTYMCSLVHVFVFVLYVCLSVCLSVYLSVCLYVCVSVSVFLFLCLSFSRSLLHSVCVCIRTRVHSIECWDAEGLATTKAVQNLIDRHVGPGDRLLLFTAGTLACLATPLSLLLLIETILPACGCGRLGGCSSPLVL